MKLSVIICTRDRAYAIVSCLDSVHAALAAAVPIEAEIVVVNNASTDDTMQVVTKWAQTSSFTVRLVEEPKAGLANARNCGIETATGEILAFTDDDCRFEIEYVNDLLRHYDASTEPVLRGGRVDLGDPTDLPLTIKTDKVAMRWHKDINSARNENLANCIVGANMTIRRDVALAIGPFDWRFSSKHIHAGEDADYIFRTYLAGIAIEYVPDMAVAHFHGRKTPKQANKLFRNYMIGSGALYTKHMFTDYNLCRQFYWDLKDGLKEILSGKSNFWPDIGFSHRKKIGYNLLGIFRFLSLSVESGLCRRHPKKGRS